MLLGDNNTYVYSIFVNTSTNSIQTVSILNTYLMSRWFLVAEAFKYGSRTKYYFDYELPSL